MAYLTNRKALKYLSDIFINPARAFALFFTPLTALLSGSILFAMAEIVHCSAHIHGALSKNKSASWKAAKTSIFVLRLASSLLGATTLCLALFMGSAAIAVTSAVIFPLAFFASSCFSTLHKLRGLFDHILKPTTPGFIDHLRYLFKNPPEEQAKQIAKTYVLLGRALVGVAGSVLMAMAIVFKVALLVSFMTTPIGFGVGCAVFGLVMLQKIGKTYQHQQALAAAPAAPAVAMSVKPASQSELLKPVLVPGVNQVVEPVVAEPQPLITPIPPNDHHMQQQNKCVPTAAYNSTP